ncbi:hypothetical protein HDU76_009182 [Blyttiomyces sp. JEL0837]|nr:hypothetical protein HDU76_009182 [Blyttiomyces sp. JEL0837]
MTTTTQEPLTSSEVSTEGAGLPDTPTSTTFHLPPPPVNPPPTPLRMQVQQQHQLPIPMGSIQLQQQQTSIPLPPPPSQPHSDHLPPPQPTTLQQRRKNPILRQGVLVHKQNFSRKLRRHVLLVNPTSTEDILYIRDELANLERSKNVKSLDEAWGDGAGSTGTKSARNKEVEVYGNLAYAAVTGDSVLIVGTTNRIFIHMCKVSYISDESDLGAPCQFAIGTESNQDYKFTCDTSPEYQQWINALSEAYEICHGDEPRRSRTLSRQSNSRTNSRNGTARSSSRNSVSSSRSRDSYLRDRSYDRDRPRSSSTARRPTSMERPRSVSRSGTGGGGSAPNLSSRSAFDRDSMQYGGGVVNGFFKDDDDDDGRSIRSEVSSRSLSRPQNRVGPDGQPIRSSLASKRKTQSEPNVAGAAGAAVDVKGKGKAVGITNGAPQEAKPASEEDVFDIAKRAYMAGMMENPISTTLPGSASNTSDTDPGSDTGGKLTPKKKDSISSSVGNQNETNGVVVGPPPTSSNKRAGYATRTGSLVRFSGHDEALEINRVAPPAAMAGAPARRISSALVSPGPLPGMSIDDDGNLVAVDEVKGSSDAKGSKRDSVRRDNTSSRRESVASRRESVNDQGRGRGSEYRERERERDRDAGRGSNGPRPPGDRRRSSSVASNGSRSSASGRKPSASNRGPPPSGSGRSTPNSNSPVPMRSSSSQRNSTTGLGAGRSATVTGGVSSSQSSSLSRPPSRTEQKRVVESLFEPEPGLFGSKKAVGSAPDLTTNTAAMNTGVSKRFSLSGFMSGAKKQQQQQQQSQTQLQATPINSTTATPEPDGSDATSVTGTGDESSRGRRRSSTSSSNPSQSRNRSRSRSMTNFMASFSLVPSVRVARTSSFASMLQHESENIRVEVEEKEKEMDKERRDKIIEERVKAAGVVPPVPPVPVVFVKEKDVVVNGEAPKPVQNDLSTLLQPAKEVESIPVSNEKEVSIQEMITMQPAPAPIAPPRFAVSIPPPPTTAPDSNNTSTTNESTATIEVPAPKRPTPGNGLPFVPAAFFAPQPEPVEPPVEEKAPVKKSFFRTSTYFPRGLKMASPTNSLPKSSPSPGPSPSPAKVFGPLFPPAIGLAPQQQQQTTAVTKTIPTPPTTPPKELNASPVVKVQQEPQQQQQPISPGLPTADSTITASTMMTSTTETSSDIGYFGSNNVTVPVVPFPETITRVWVNDPRPSDITGPPSDIVIMPAVTQQQQQQEQQEQLHALPPPPPIFTTAGPILLNSSSPTSTSPLQQQVHPQSRSSSPQNGTGMRLRKPKDIAKLLGFGKDAAGKKETEVVVGSTGVVVIKGDDDETGTEGQVGQFETIHSVKTESVTAQVVDLHPLPPTPKSTPSPLPVSVPSTPAVVDSVRGNSGSPIPPPRSTSGSPIPPLRTFGSSTSLNSGNGNGPVAGGVALVGLAGAGSFNSSGNGMGAAGGGAGGVKAAIAMFEKRTSVVGSLGSSNGSAGTGGKGEGAGGEFLQVEEEEEEEDEEVKHARRILKGKQRVVGL